MKPSVDFAVRNCGQIVTPRKSGEFSVIENGAVAAEEGKVVFLGVDDDFETSVDLRREAEVIDAGGNVLLPGFIDPHTHIVFAGYREEEFNKRIKGKTYEEITSGGGGILSTVRETRKASRSALLESSLKRVEKALLHGTTTLEIKSGYGLTYKSEIKLLEVIRELDGKTPVDIVPTFLGAHTFPPEYTDNPEGYVRLLTEKLTPEVGRRNLAQYCDVFCEKGAFSPEQSMKILETAASHGMAPKIHAEQLSYSGGSKVAEKAGAISAEHLEYIPEDMIESFAQNDITAVLLPGASFFIRQDVYPPARDLLDKGVDIALATDCNPGTCYTENMGLIITLGVLEMGMTIEEVITAVTLNAAKALNLSETYGSLEKGKVMDALICDIPNYYHLVYNMGINHIKHVIKKGKTIHST